VQLGLSDAATQQQLLEAVGKLTGAQQEQLKQQKAVQVQQEQQFGNHEQQQSLPAKLAQHLLVTGSGNSNSINIPATPDAAATPVTQGSLESSLENGRWVFSGQVPSALDYTYCDWGLLWQAFLFCCHMCFFT
jgi:hypothetical protein